MHYFEYVKLEVNYHITGDNYINLIQTTIMLG